jgi:hypothetical protein
MKTTEFRSRTKATQSDTLSPDSREDESHIHIIEGYEDIPTAVQSDLPRAKPKSARYNFLP